MAASLGAIVDKAIEGRAARRKALVDETKTHVKAIHQRASEELGGVSRKRRASTGRKKIEKAGGRTKALAES